MATVVKSKIKTGTKTQATRASQQSKTQTIRREWKAQDEKLVRSLAKTATPVREIARKLDRTEGALRQKAFAMGVSFKTKARMAANKALRRQAA